MTKLIAGIRKIIEAFQLELAAKPRTPRTARLWTPLAAVHRRFDRGREARRLGSRRHPHR